MGIDDGAGHRDRRADGEIAHPEARDQDEKRHHQGGDGLGVARGKGIEIGAQAEPVEAVKLVAEQELGPDPAEHHLQHIDQDARGGDGGEEERRHHGIGLERPGPRLEHLDARRAAERGEGDECDHQVRGRGPKIGQGLEEFMPSGIETVEPKRRRAVEIGDKCETEKRGGGERQDHLTARCRRPALPCPPGACPRLAKPRFAQPRWKPDVAHQQ